MPAGLGRTGGWQRGAPRGRVASAAVHVFLFWTLLCSTLGIALAVGGAPERWTAAMLGIAAVLSHLLYRAAAHRYSSIEPAIAVIDLTLLLGLTVILLKADRFWPVAMFAVQGAAVLAHVVKMLDETIVRQAYAISIAAPSYLTIAILLAAIHRHRIRLRSHGLDRDWSHGKS